VWRAPRNTSGQPFELTTATIVEIVYDAAGRQSSVLADVWAHRELLARLVVRNLKMRYQRSALGFLWALLNPLATIAILVAVFHYVIRIGVDDYWAFLISGYFAWVFVQHTLAMSAGVITEHSYMTRSLAFPAEILVLSSVLARLVEYVAELALVVIAVGLFHHDGVPMSVSVLPIIVAIHVILTVGIAMPIAAASVFFKDVQHGVPVALMMLGYLSPVFYPISLVPERFHALYLMNPVAAMLTLYHQTLYDGQFPSLALLAWSATISLLACTVGVALFRRQRALFAEIV
jgi:ABC-2 type transport system permease protein